MCLCSCDYDPPVAYAEEWRRARTVKRCCECGGHVLWGDRLLGEQDSGEVVK